MPFELVFAPEAEQDLAEAYDWYEERRPGLGDEFLGCVEAALEGLARKPLMYPKVHKDFRRVLVRRFPYSIIFEVAESEVHIFAVFHSSKDPEKWRR